MFSVLGGTKVHIYIKIYMFMYLYLDLCWSTGVQVGLQLALDRPDLVESMVLCQGTVGTEKKVQSGPL